MSELCRSPLSRPNYHGLGLSLMHQERYDQAERACKSFLCYNETGDLSAQAAVLSSLRP